VKIIDDGRKSPTRSYEAAIAEQKYLRTQLLSLLPKDAIILAPATDGAAPAFRADRALVSSRGSGHLRDFLLLQPVRKSLVICRWEYSSWGTPCRNSSYFRQEKYWNMLYSRSRSL